MPRPSRNLTRISVYLPADALFRLDMQASRLSADANKISDAELVTRSAVIRLAVEDYLQRKP